jgi:hypothetical protein
MRERAATTTIGVLACTTIISMVVVVLQLIEDERGTGVRKGGSFYLYVTGGVHGYSVAVHTTMQPIHKRMGRKIRHDHIKCTFLPFSLILKATVPRDF